MGCGTLIALGTAAAGAGMQSAAAAGEQDAMNAATGQQVAWQNALSQKGQEVASQSAAQSTPAAMTQQQQQGAQLAQAATQQAALAPLASASTATTPGANVAYSAQGAKNSLAQQANAQQQGYGNIGLQQYLKDLAANSQLGALQTQSQRYASIYPSMMQSAANSEQGLSAAGGLVGALGSLAGTAYNQGLFTSKVPTSVGWSSALNPNYSWGFTPTNMSAAASSPYYFQQLGL